MEGVGKESACGDGEAHLGLGGCFKRERLRKDERWWSVRGHWTRFRGVGASKQTR